ncbi:hypothetical protein JHC09_12470 [Devosia sp. MC532]|uniref:hypothetical protein n=1 Tax=Devosia sp. MC532 TaxID=2799788 RepID=UPI0018F4DD12|nr:hypothetical protein [Devosia sp. MC532]MBJ7578696.1 hypothetical protein [Devosia sp. MC532]
MDEKKADTPDRRDEDIRVEPDISSTLIDETIVPAEDFASEDHQPPVARPSKIPIVLSIASMIVAIGVAGAAATLHLANQNEIMRLSTELAQLRVSLDLYARGSNSNTGSQQLSALTERLTALEERQTSAPEPAPASPLTTAPVPAPLTTPAPTAGVSDDCLPAGMRLLVTTGDSYPICDQPATIDVSLVDSGYITLVDGTIVPSGVAVPLPNSTCTVSVTSSGDEGLTGYAEIRVTC